MAELDIQVLDNKNSTWELKILNPFDEKGILYRITAVLFSHGWDIVQARATSTESPEVEDQFVVRSTKSDKFDDGMLKTVKDDLTSLLSRAVSPTEYLDARADAISVMYKKIRDEKDHDLKVSSETIDSLNVIEIQSTDRPGVLMLICEVLDLLSFNIVAFELNRVGKQFRDKLSFTRADGTLVDKRGLFLLEHLLTTLL